MPVELERSEDIHSLTDELPVTNDITMDDEDTIVISCLWCSNVCFTSNHLYDYITIDDVGVNDQWVIDATQDLCHCSDCVDTYHHALEKAFKEDVRFTNDLRKTVYTNDLARLEKYLNSILSKCRNHTQDSEDLSEEDMMNFSLTQRSRALQQELECPLLEILKHPHLLLNRSMNELFVSALNEMEAVHQQLEVLNKYPGIYLLLVHQNLKVRCWAKHVVQSLGQVEWDDFDNLQEVMIWMITIITFDQFVEPVEDSGSAAWDPSLTLLLPKHLFVYESPKEFWDGLCIFITTLSGSCIRSKFIGSCNELILAILNALDCHASNSVAFWPALQCLSTLLDQLGSRFWQYVPHTRNFDYVLNCILESHIFEDEILKWNKDSTSPQISHHDTDLATSAESFRSLPDEKPLVIKSEFPVDVSPVKVTVSVHQKRMAFTWIVPFLQSLLDFGETAFKSIRTLFHAVHSFPNKGSKGCPLFKESLFTLSQMVQLLFSKRAFSIMWNFKRMWLPAVEIVLCSTENVSQPTSMMHVFTVPLEILDTAEAKQLHFTSKVVTYLKTFTSSFKSSKHNRTQNVSPIPAEDVTKHIAKVLKMLSTKYTNPALEISEQTEMQAVDVQEHLQPHSSGTGAAGDEGISDFYYREFPSDSSTMDESIINYKPPASKKTPRKRKLYKKPLVKPIPSDESTDELESFEPHGNSNSIRRKYSSVKLSSPSTFKQKSKVNRPQTVFFSDTTTDDLDEDHACESPKKNINDALEDANRSLVHFSNTFTSGQDRSSVTTCSEEKLKSSYLLPHKDFHTLNNKSIDSKSPLKLKKSSSSKFKFIEKKSLSPSSSRQGTLLCLHLNADNVKQESVNPRKLSSTNTSTPVISLDELNDFDNFSDTAPEANDLPTVKRKKRVLSSTNIELCGEARENKVRSSNRVDKVREWLKSSSEDSALDMRIETKLDNDLSTHCTVTSPSTEKEVCDLHDESSSLKAQVKPVTSTQGQENIKTEAMTIEVNSRSVKDRLSVDSTSSTDSSLPKFNLEQELQPLKVSKVPCVSTPKQTESKHSSNEDDTEYQVQSSVITTTESVEDTNNLQPLSVVLVEQQSDLHNVIDSVPQQSKNKSENPVSVDDLSFAECNTPELQEVSLTLNDIADANLTQKPICEASAFQASNNDNSEILKVTLLSDLPADGDDAVKQTHRKGTGLKVTKNLYGKSRSSDSPYFKKSKSQEKGKQPVSHSGKRRSLLTDIPGMTYSARKAVLKTSIDARLPSPSTSVQRLPLPKTQLSPAPKQLSSSKDSNTVSSRNKVNVQLPSSSVQEKLPLNQCNNSRASISSSRSRSIDTVPKACPKSNIEPPSIHPLTSGKNSKNTGVHFTSFTSRHIPKAQISGISPSSSSLSLETQRVLDNVGWSSSSGSDASAIPPPQRPPQCNALSTMARRHIPLKPSILPKADDLLLEILSWDAGSFLSPKQMENGKLIEPTVHLKEPFRVPMTFKSYDHYFCTFKPLLFLELSSMIFSDIHHPDRQSPKPKPLSGKILSVTRAGPNLQVVMWKTSIPKAVARMFAHPVEDDLVSIDFSHLDERIYSSVFYLSGQELQFHFAMVESVSKDFNSQTRYSKHESREHSQCELVLNLRVSGLGFALNDILGGSVVELNVITSLKTVRRQWNGLINLHTSVLVRDILCPRGGVYFCCQRTAYEQPKHSSKHILDYNESQLNVIQDTVKAVSLGFAHPRICLIQGPPGTGKTHTISGIVSAVLTKLTNQSNPSHACRSLPGQPSSAVHKQNKPRILICAPSNAAVDEVIRRLAKDGVINTDGKDKSRDLNSQGRPPYKRKFYLVRIGQSERIHPDLVGLSLDEQAKQLLAKESDAVTGTSANLNNIRSELQRVDREIYKMEKQLNIHQHSFQSKEPNVKLRNEFSVLKERLARYKTKRQASSDQYKEAKLKSDSKIKGAVIARKSVLLKADIICSTLSGSASTALRECRSGFQFSCIIVDEAAQCPELDVLIPLNYMCSKLVLVGDPLQLPAVVKSQKAAEYGYERSLFERFYMSFSDSSNPENPVHLLNIQYRMLPEICDFPSKHFYKGHLRTDEALVKERERSPFYPFLVFDVANGSEINCGTSHMNLEECALSLELVKLLLSKGVASRNIGIITPYKAQEKQIRNRLKDHREYSIEVGTVDGFQGREKEFIIISCVRAQSTSGSIGFLSKSQRMNVAITRSKTALYVLGHLKSLKVNEDWRALIDHAKKQSAIIPVKENHAKIAERILKTQYKHQADGTLCSSPGPSKNETISYLQQPSRVMSDSSVDRHHIESELKQSPIKIPSTKPWTPHQPSLASRPFSSSTSPVRHHLEKESAANHLLSLNLFMQRNNKPSDKPEYRASDLRVHSHVSAASILQQLPRKNEEGKINLDCSNHVQLVSGINIQSEEVSSKSHQQRPTSLPISLSSIAVSDVSTSSEFVSARVSDQILSPTERTSETNIRGRGTKRVAHMSNTDIKIRRQDIEHKLLASASSPPAAKRPRISSTSSSRKGLRAELMKKMSKK